jgi:hypothetical protein
MIRQLLRDERGSVVAWVALWIPLLILVATLVIDVGNWWTHRRHLQNQVDAGALAAGANYSLPSCQTDATLQDKTADEAMSYSGTTRRISPGNSPKTRNPQVSNSANVFVTINSTTFWDGPSSGSAPDYSDGGGPCFFHANDIKGFWTDVKATERNLPWLIPFAGTIVPRIQARARVAVKKAIIFTNTMPLAVPDVNPTLVKAFLIDECTGAQLPGGDLTLTRPDPLQQDLWSGTTAAPVTFPGPSGSCTGANARNGKVGVRVLMSGGANTACGQALVECYDTGSANGIYAARVWTAPTGPEADPGGWTAASCGATPVTVCAQTTFLPYVTDVELDVNPLCFGYFTDTNCTANIAATVVRGTGANSFSVGTFNTMDASYPGGTSALTDPDNDGVFTGTIPINTAGPYPISLAYHWELKQNGPTWRTIVCSSGGSNDCKTPTNGTTSWGVVHRGFRASSTRSGPIQQIELRSVTSPPTGLIESVQAGYSDTVTVSLRVSGTLRPQDKPNDPIVALRAFDGSQTQSIDCMPGVNFRDELAGGCGARYKLNDGSDPAWNPCPQPDSVGSPPPWQCVPTQTGGTIGQFGDGLGARLGNTSSCENVNHWPEVGTGTPGIDPLVNQNDPRAVKLYLVPFGAFAGTGNQNYPITNVGLFYITGFGANGSNDDKCPDKPGGLEDPANSGDLVGHFFKRVGINDDELIPNDEACIANSITPCVAVLVD